MYLAVSTSKYCFILRQSAPLSDLVFKLFSGVPTYKTFFYIATEFTVRRPRFQNCLSSSNFQRIISNNARKHHIASLFSNVRKHRLVPLISKVSQQFRLLGKKEVPGYTNPDHFPIWSKLYFAHATPLVTYV